MNRARDWIAKARSFHNRQLAKHRKVMRLGTSRIVLTKGQAITTSGAVFAAGSASSSGLPDWIFWSVLLGGILGGRFVFPVPDSSIASKRGPVDVSGRSAAELDSMTPEEIRTYENNMVLKHRLKDFKGLGTAQALHRQSQAVQASANVASVAVETLAGLSVVDAEAYRAAAARHDGLSNRWLDYEINPHLQFDFPAMSDAAFPPTAAMIRAKHAAEQARSAGRPAEYQSSVAAFGEALTAAEVAAGVTGS
ncbi:hypothetical protein NG702_19085 [Pseudarthrobacter sp. MDT3-28]|uniref:hypothetical protein n=1 Tax=Pseudarthrobacter raffinosi TaxID=2953651 RepID=UPI00208E8739|nr:hypothetical protein [Pseudarthrobacter sp. MDT3-28]MCO4239482.1 hypothetical protein [Pseudarthrobacter sp. MDT3-28]